MIEFNLEAKREQEANRKKARAEMDAYIAKSKVLKKAAAIELGQTNSELKAVYYSTSSTGTWVLSDYKEIA